MAVKFWLINDFEKKLLAEGLPQPISDIITFISALVVLFLVLSILDYIGNKVILKILHETAKRTKSKWDDYLMERHFFRRLLRFIIAVIIIFLIETIFSGFEPKLISTAIIATKSLSIYYFIKVVNSFIDTLNDIYMTTPQAKEKSIKGYVQSAKIVVVIMAIVAVASIIFNISVSKILLSLATSAAILTLVFKDTILGFVASIQLSAQDMVRLGDWIVVESNGANGTVIELNVNTCKVLNWDNTTSMVPIYTLVSSPFINWRTMEEGEGRRFKIPFNIDVTSIKKIAREELQKLETSTFFSEYYKEMMSLKNLYSVEGTTNLSLFRAYGESYLRNNKFINENMTLLVRYLPMSENGIVLEFYGFSSEKSWYKYESIVAQVTEQMVATAITLELRIYQRNASLANIDNKPQPLNL